MKLLAEPLGVARRVALMTGAITFAILAVLAIATRAGAAEKIYWDNYQANSVAFANLDGSGGGSSLGTESKWTSPKVWRSTPQVGASSSRTGKAAKKAKG